MLLLILSIPILRSDFTASWGRVPNGTLYMRFTCCPNLKFLPISWLEIYIFSNWSFCWLWAVQNWESLNGQVKIHSIYPFYWLWASHSCFSEFGQDVRPQKTIQTLSTWQKIQEPCIGSGTSHFQWFNQRESRTAFPNWIIDFKGSIFYFFLNTFFWLLWLNKISMIRIKTQKVLHKWGNIF